MIRNIALCLILIFMSGTVCFGAEDSVQLTVVGSATAENPSAAKNAALKNALEKGLLQIIQGLIGDAKMEKSTNLIKNRILTQSSKFIQFYKAGDATVTEKETTLAVIMKISVSSVRDVLAQEGILYQSDGPYSVLPAIKIVERRSNGKQYRWWMEEPTAQNNHLKDHMKVIVRELENAFKTRNFAMTDPVTQHYVQWLPDTYRQETLDGDEIQFLGEFFKTQLIISGEVALEEGSTSGAVKLLAKLTVYHAVNGRVVAEVVRQSESPPSDWELASQQLVRKTFEEISGDLAKQVVDQWNSGTFGSNLLKVTVNGRMLPKDIEEFKKQFQSQFKEVRMIKERLMTRDSFKFELDSTASLSALAKKIESSNFDGFKLAVDNLEPDQVVVRWSRMASQ